MIHDHGPESLGISLNFINSGEDSGDTVFAVIAGRHRSGFTIIQATRRDGDIGDACSTRISHGPGDRSFTRLGRSYGRQNQNRKSRET